MDHPVASVRAIAAGSFFNQALTLEQRATLLRLAQTDEAINVRARSWESLIDATEEPEVVAVMLQALHNPDLPIEERSGLLVGLAPETDRNEVRKAIADLYTLPAAPRQGAGSDVAFHSPQLSRIFRAAFG